MHNSPEQTPAAKSEEIKESEEPGETELRLILECAKEAKHQANHGAASEQQRQTSEASGFEILTLGCGHDLGTFAHFFCAAGLGAGLASGGLASAFSSFTSSSGGISAA